ncbi:MAG: hypothetical protein ACI9W0_002880, partial [Gammaproteobacteria bacterium]
KKPKMINRVLVDMSSNDGSFSYKSMRIKLE